MAYKINTAFYESRGAKGWEELEETVSLIPKSHFTIADAKRGDIGNTSRMYAKAFFEKMNFDAITVAPYMGEDSVKPFLEFQNKWVIILALTSNRSSQDFQLQKIGDQLLYEQVLTTAKEWGTTDNTMFVVGATHPASFIKIRSLVPDHFLLVPGVGAQGGSLDQVFKYNNASPRMLVNSSRRIIFASDGEDFQEAAEKKAKSLSEQMTALLTV